MQLTLSDLRGLAMLASTGTVEVDRIVEDVQRKFGPGPKTISRLVHTGVRTIAGGVRLASNFGLGVISNPPDPDSASPQRERFIAALNGVIGDHLADTSNPLAIRACLRSEGKTAETVEGRVVLGVHGLCMSDLGFMRDGVDHVAAVAAAMGRPALYAKLNSGLPVHANGLILSELIAGCEDVVVVAHSLGGLITRSAINQGATNISAVAFLGTPHHGARLERHGNWLETIIGKTPYVGPLSRLGQLRSAAITDLRFGHITAGPIDRFGRGPDTREVIPTPPAVRTVCIAGDRGRGTDGLVDIASALGRHESHDLGFTNSHVVPSGHMNLLSDPRVAEHLIAWATTL